MNPWQITLVVIACIIVWLALIRLVRRFAKFPAPSFIGAALDSWHRRKMEPPREVIERSGIKPGMQVLEIGCGSGAFTVDVARAVGETGKVYGLDIEEKMLAQLKKKLSRPENSDIKNIEMVNKSAYELPFEDGSMDVVYMVTVFQEIPDKNRSLAEIKRVLKPGGILAISEWFVDPDYPLKSTTAKQVTVAGFKNDKVSGNWWHYTAKFIKPS
jgi:ubiquinone/menaquinone biosynthesis C-methylase UbiE